MAAVAMEEEPMTDYIDEDYDYEEQELVPPEPLFYCVSIYLADLSCGGPEEGGWYYEHGEPCLEQAYLTRCFPTREEAREYRRSLDNFIDSLNEGRPSMCSVLSIGRYVARIDDGHYPEHYPKRRPHYE
jgi:hypothetical protein